MSNESIIKRERYDYFLIWGNGLQYRGQILDFLREQPDIKILKIVNHKPKSIKKLVRKIYSHDYAPLQHLKVKTKYLLKTTPEVVFIFIQNLDTQESYFGSGAFRHIECIRIKQMKETLRDQFNPRIDGLRTEEHVIHASDNPSQVDVALKYLGFKNGTALFRNVPNPFLSLPHYLPKFDHFNIQTIKTSQLFGRVIVMKKNRRADIVKLEETPQFSCLKGDISVYEDYLAKYSGWLLQSDYSVDKFRSLAEKFSYLSSPYPTAYILVKEFRPNQYLILDGLHRASIMKYQGAKMTPVAIIK